MEKHLKRLVLFLAVAAWALAGCSNKGPEAISFGSDTCAGCGMTASDPKFGAELITRKGKILKFDSVECLAGFLNKNGKGEAAASLWVVDFAHPSQLIDATRAVYLKSDTLHSPMGLDLSAFCDRVAADGNNERYPGTILGWPDVLKYVGQRWSREGECGRQK